MKGPGSTMTILQLISNLKKEKISWFGDVSGGLANDKGYILIQSCFIIRQNQYQLHCESQ
jgi:hypothetical protein